MANNKTSSKKKQKKRKPIATKKSARKAKPVAKKKLAAKRKTTPKEKVARSKATVQLGSQSVETVRVQPKALSARAGVGAGDYQGVSTMENVDSESAEELLEEGQAFEAGIVSGVENAPDPDEAEVITREVPQDDVPGEYEDKDRL